MACGHSPATSATISMLSCSVSLYGSLLLYTHLSVDLRTTLLQNDLISRSLAISAETPFSNKLWGVQVHGARAWTYHFGDTNQPTQPHKVTYCHVQEIRTWTSWGMSLCCLPQYVSFFAKFLFSRSSEEGRKMQFPCCNYDLFFECLVFLTKQWPGVFMC